MTLKFELLSLSRFNQFPYLIWPLWCVFLQFQNRDCCVYLALLSLDCVWEWKWGLSLLDKPSVCRSLTYRARGLTFFSATLE